VNLQDYYTLDPALEPGAVCQPRVHVRICQVPRGRCVRGGGGALSLLDPEGMSPATLDSKP